MQQELQLRGEGNRVVTLFGRVFERSWSEIAATPYAHSAESWYLADAVPPRAALFVVGDMEHWYASAADDAAHAAWFAATDPGRETAICLKHPGGQELPSTMPGVDDGGDLPCRAIDGISEVRTTTYGTHGATTRLEISPSSREPIPGTIWLPGWAWDPRRQMWDSRRPGYVWTGEVTGITRYLTHHDLFVAPTSPPEGIDSGQRWLIPTLRAAGCGGG